MIAVTLFPGSRHAASGRFHDLTADRHNDVMDGTPCNDGVRCNGPDQCISGACDGHEPGLFDCGYKMYCHVPSDSCLRCGDAGFVCCPNDPGQPGFCFPSECCSDNMCRNTCT